MENHSIKFSEDDTHRSLVSKGSIPNHNYRHAKIITTDIPTPSVEVSEKKEEKVWRSCCLELSPKCIVYTGQYSISIIVLGICTWMLIKAEGSCEQASAPYSIISFLLGKLLATVASST